jgi:hypothetical protein
MGLVDFSSVEVELDDSGPVIQQSAWIASTTLTTSLETVTRTSSSTGRLARRESSHNFEKCSQYCVGGADDDLEVDPLPVTACKSKKSRTGSETSTILSGVTG